MGTGPRFVADAMLGSLARKMRIIGFDVAYFREGSDPELEALATEEDRVILTSDRGLSEHAVRHGARALLVNGRSDRVRLEGLVGSASGSSIPLVPGPTRCAECNVELERVSKREVLGELARGVAARHREYYRCPGCHKLYWKGSHWTRLRRMTSLFPRRQTIYSSGRRRAR